MAAMKAVLMVMVCSGVGGVASERGASHKHINHYERSRKKFHTANHGHYT